MIRYAAGALIVLAATAARPEPPRGRDLTSTEQRLMDGAYVYLVSPDYCDPAPPADRLRAWITGLLERHEIPSPAAAAYLAEQEPRLRLIAEAAFTGRRGKELCHSLLALGGTAPELAPPGPPE